MRPFWIKNASNVYLHEHEYSFIIIVTSLPGMRNSTVVLMLQVVKSEPTSPPALLPTATHSWRCCTTALPPFLQHLTNAAYWIFLIKICSLILPSVSIIHRGAGWNSANVPLATLRFLWFSSVPQANICKVPSNFPRPLLTSIRIQH